MNMAFDAIIVGGGPAGASMAIFLSQAGWSVALVEKQRYPRRKVCGECIAATNLSLLDALGVGEAFHQIAGLPLHKVALMNGPHTVHAKLPALNIGAHPWGKALGREYLDTLLVTRAVEVGTTVLQPWVVRSITGAPGDYRCGAIDVESGQERILSAPVVIAAHGSWELAPDATSGARQGKTPAAPSDLFAFKANFAAADLDAGMICVLGFAGGYGGMVVGEHGVMTLACCVRRDRLADARRVYNARSAAEAIERLLIESCAGVQRALAPARLTGAWLSTGPIRPGIRINRSSEFFLIGNAAGEAHPIVGEGMSMAMQSAWLLSRSLTRHRHLLNDAEKYRRVKRDYLHQWQSSFAPRIRLAAILAHASMRPGAMAIAMPLLQRWPHLLTAAARLSGKARPIDPTLSVSTPGTSYT